jgi:hypothetical protein
MGKLSGLPSGAVEAMIGLKGREAIMTRPTRRQELEDEASPVA